MRLRLPAALASVALACVLTACGRSDSPAITPSSDTAPPATATTP